MTITKIAFTALLFSLTLTACQAQRKPQTVAAKRVATYVAPTASEIEQKVDALLRQMTLEEKVGQMAQITLDVIGKGENRYSSFEPL
ncbi:beta-glucosidase, partial [Pontibacter qinzhouensis]